MERSQGPDRSEAAALASAVQADFRALVDLLSRDANDGELRAKLAELRAAAERGLELANRLVRDLGATKDPEGG